MPRQLTIMLAALFLSVSADCLSGEAPAGPWGRNFDTTYLESLYPQEFSRPARPDRALPPAEELVGMLRKQCGGKHPRTCFTAIQLEEFKRQMAADGKLKAYVDNMLRQFHSQNAHGGFASGKKRGHNLDYRRLGLLYHVTGDKAIADAAWQLTEQAMVDVAQPTEQFCWDAHVLGTAYDLFADAWSAERRAIFEKFLERYMDMGLKLFRNPMGIGFRVTCRTNIGLQSQAGYLTLAVALADRYPEQCGEILHEALGAFAAAFEEFAPDGGWREGPGYWGYAASGGVIPGMTVIKNALGTTFGLDAMPGFKEVAYFAQYVTAPAGHRVFVFGDSGEIWNLNARQYWFATFLDMPDVGRMLADDCGGDYLGIVQKCNALPIPYRPDLLARKASSSQVMPLGRSFRRIEMGSLRSAWNDPDAWHVAFKGGYPADAHSNIHSGTFVVDALGERWITSGSGDNYIAEDAWNYTPLGGRWRMFGARAESKNCLVVNTSFLAEDRDSPQTASTGYVYPDQYPLALSKLTRFELNDGGSKPGGLGVIDLTHAYRDFCDSVKRGFRLSASGDSVTVQDEVRFRHRAFYDAWWLGTLYLDTEVRIAADGMTAVLGRNGKQIRVRLLCDMPGARFTELPMTPLPQSQAIMIEKKHWEKCKRLPVHLVNADRLNRDGFTLRVVFEPIARNQGKESLTPLDVWKPTPQKAQLTL